MNNSTNLDNCRLCCALDTCDNVPVCNGGMIWPEGVPENPPCYERPDELSRSLAAVEMRLGLRLVKGGAA